MNYLKILIILFLILSLKGCSTVPVNGCDCRYKDQYKKCEILLIKCNDALKSEYEFLDQMDVEIKKEKTKYRIQGFLVGSSSVGLMAMIIILIILI